ncbi:MAG: N-acetyltransferase [Vulcanimicrobiota bacterium]
MSRLHFLRQPPPAELRQALLEFEQQFTYPLGANDSFSISHGPDYVTFFQAIGEATVLVIEEEGRILGTLAAVVRTLQLPGGSHQTVAYLADLKLGREVRHRLTRYLIAMSEHLNVASGCGYAVVMDGTRSTPDRYTGRWGVPAFRPQAKLTVLTLQTRPFQGGPGPEAPAAEAPQAVLPLGGHPQLRSEMAPRQLAWGGARGRLEDTRRGKRLLHCDGQEMRAAHLSAFRYQDEREGVALLEQAAGQCASLGIPTLFACLPEPKAQRLLAHLRQKHIQVNPAPATVFAVGFPADWTEWWVDSAEI